MCKKPCISCPFAFTDVSEQAQAMGCLPSPYDILKIKKETGNNWACHSASNKVCQGLTNHLEEEVMSLTTDTGKLHIQEENFGRFFSRDFLNYKEMHFVFPILLDLNGLQVIKKHEFIQSIKTEVRNKRENNKIVYEY